MPSDDSLPDPPSDELPMVEVWLEVGDALRLGSSVLRILDTEGEDAMLRLDDAKPEVGDDTRWEELPR